MLRSNSEKTRHTIPRWNSLENAERLGELSSLKKANRKPEFNSEVLGNLLLEWRAEKNLPLATEIISTAKIIHSEEDISQVVDFARKSISELDDVPPLLQELICDKLPETTLNLDKVESRIRNAKKLLVKYPNNPLLWNELARDYIIDGQRKKSERAIHVAYGLAPNNRVVLRSIARFYDHVGDPDQALHFLRKSPLLKNDPWILSSEIAISNDLGKTSKNIKLAQGIVSNNNINPRSYSELASELGTMDFIAGNSKQGKRKLELAIFEPFENAAAQIVWINENIQRIDSVIARMPQTVDCNYEAEALLRYEANDWETAQKYSALWQKYQPFSRDPAMFNSFVSADYLMDYNSAREAAVQGILSNPNDEGLWNNLIYALVLSGELDKAKQDYDQKVSSFAKENDIALIATGGLLQYRTGNFLEGRKLYLKALDKAKKIANLDFYFRALLCFAREEKRAGLAIGELLNQINDSKYKAFQVRYQKIVDNYGILS